MGRLFIFRRSLSLQITFKRIAVLFGVPPRPQLEHFLNSFILSSFLSYNLFQKVYNIAPYLKRNRAKQKRRKIVKENFTKITARFKPTNLQVNLKPTDLQASLKPTNLQASIQSSPSNFLIIEGFSQNCLIMERGSFYKKKFC